MRKLLSAALGIGFAAASASLPANGEDLGDVLMDKSTGCMEGPIAQFGRYIGDWDIADEGLQQDGVTWQPGNGARWNFTCVGDGIAVQDFWMPNGADSGPPPGVGTNLRIYDAENDHWDIAWTATRSTGSSHIRAKMNEDGNIIMHWITPEQTPARRITFFPPTDAGWDWVMEMDLAGDGNWAPVYKIKATPRQ